MPSSPQAGLALLIGLLVVVAASCGLIDLLFLVLAVSSAYKLARTAGGGKARQS